MTFGSSLQGAGGSTKKYYWCTKRATFVHCKWCGMKKSPKSRALVRARQFWVQFSLITSSFYTEELTLIVLRKSHQIRKLSISVQAVCPVGGAWDAWECCRYVLYYDMVFVCRENESETSSEAQESGVGRYDV